MRLVYRPLLASLLAAAACLSLLACGGGGDGIGEDDLETLVLGTGEVGERYTGWSFDPAGSGELPNQRVVEESFDPADEAGDVERFSRRAGHGLALVDARSAALGRPFAAIATIVHLHADAGGASAQFRDSSEELRALGGRTLRDGSLMERVEPFEAGALGEETHAAVVTIRAGSAAPLYFTHVRFRISAVIGEARVIRQTPEDARDEAKELARALERKVREAE